MNLFEHQRTEFQRRHIGPNAADTQQMLETIGMGSMEELISKTVPDSIRIKKPLNVPAAMGEFEYLQHLQGIAAKNQLF